ncbi:MULTISPECIES: hypothetical protein [unclassified Modestobacter]|uniref:hypothetical protein n=1 Tax=unclassified Modestobacter TaxID=2643866 RepID=UPI0022AA1AAA|nr:MULTISPECIES: hypothetical protein [unclassified Modestobacter]MCZ2826861.1 hypothetical protein [Modestobacter sp. VKM Ac-2981]MCZ2855443.1 hypothetical protein [Modestobacter sp. VKM Ac-2982]
MPTRHSAVHDHRTSHDAAKLRVVVTDAIGLQRVLTVLTGRRHGFTRLSAEETGDGRWTIGLDLIAAPGEVDLVAARLHRLPCVLTVDVTLAGRLASTA